MLRGLLVGLALTTFHAQALTAEEKPNVVIVLADDVSWSSFGCVDAGLYTRTPNIDKLASQSIRFSNFSCSVAQCGPLRHELYTALLPPTSGVYANGSKARGEYENITHYLGRLNYRVGITGKTHFKNEADFVKVPGFESNGNANAPEWEISGVRKFVEASHAADKPFCMVIASVHAHHPWTIGDVTRFPADKMVVPPHMVDGPVTREALAKHAAEVEDLDNQVGATMQLLDDMKLADNTILIFLSEQGTAMPNGKWSIYDYGTRALCLMRWPGKIKPSTVTDAVAMYCDIVPTLVDIAGGKAPATDGKSFLPVLKGETSVHREHAFLVHEYGGYTQRAIRNKEHKLIWNPKQDNSYYVDTLMAPDSKKFFGGVWREWLVKARNDVAAQTKVSRILKHPEFELYNIQNDPWELNNLAGKPEFAQKLKTMHAQLKSDMEKLNDSFSSVDPKKEKRERKKHDDSKKKDSKKKKRKRK